MYTGYRIVVFMRHSYWPVRNTAGVGVGRDGGQRDYVNCCIAAWWLHWTCWFPSKPSPFFWEGSHENKVEGSINVQEFTMKIWVLLFLWMLLNFHTHIPPSASQNWIFMVNSDSLISFEEFIMPSFSVCFTGWLICSPELYEMIFCYTVSEAPQWKLWRLFWASQSPVRTVFCVQVHLPTMKKKFPKLYWHLLSGQSPEAGHWMGSGNFYPFGDFWDHHFYMMSRFDFRASAVHEHLDWNNGSFLSHTGRLFLVLPQGNRHPQKLMSIYWSL